MGVFNAKEIYRLLKKGGLFITQQVGEDNDRDLVEMVLSNTENPFSHLNLREQKKYLKMLDFKLLKKMRPIVQLNFSMWVHLCGLHILSNGNFQSFRLIDA